MSRNSHPAFMAGDRIGSKIADAARSLRDLEKNDPEAYAAEIAKGKATAEKYRRMARGIK